MTNLSAADERFNRALHVMSWPELGLLQHQLDQAGDDLGVVIVGLELNRRTGQVITVGPEPAG